MRPGLFSSWSEQGPLPSCGEQAFLVLSVSPGALGFQQPRLPHCRAEVQ